MRRAGRAPGRPQAGPRPLGGPADVPVGRGAAGRAPGRSQAGPRPLGGPADVPVGRGADITHLLYLHGFRSSPQSAKAQKVAGWVQRHRPDLHWWCPQLPPSPKLAMQTVADGIAAWPRDRMAVIGSSLGGFYATGVAQREGCPAVLLNPAVNPARDLAKFIGETTAWHSDDRFFFRAEFVDELKALTPPAITRPERYFAVIAKGDEVLDWREMSSRYAGCHIKLLEGGDHALSDFDAHLQDLLDFLGVAPPLTNGR